MPLVVTISPNALAQVGSQVAFIAQDSPGNALSWEARLRRTIRDLGDRPFHSPDRAATARVGFAVCKLLFERPYLVHYAIDAAAGTLVVINFRHGARLPRPGEP